MSETVPLFTTEQWSSVRHAIGQEIAEAQKGAETTWLEIDGIDDLGKSASGYK